jgi:hypothetical protein
VLIDFLMKSLAKSNDVVVRNKVGGLRGWTGVDSESHVIKKMKTREINSCSLFLPSSCRVENHCPFSEACRQSN